MRAPHSQRAREPADDIIHMMWMTSARRCARAHSAPNGESLHTQRACPAKQNVSGFAAHFLPPSSSYSGFDFNMSSYTLRKLS
jgi:hypothetical protein